MAPPWPATVEAGNPGTSLAVTVATVEPIFSAAGPQPEPSTRATSWSPSTCAAEAASVYGSGSAIRSSSRDHGGRGPLAQRRRGRALRPPAASGGPPGPAAPRALVGVGRPRDDRRPPRAARPGPRGQPAAARPRAGPRPPVRRTGDVALPGPV